MCDSPGTTVHTDTASDSVATAKIHHECMTFCSIDLHLRRIKATPTSTIVSVPDLIRAAIASSIPPRKTVWGTAYLQLVTVEFNSFVAEALLTK